MTNPWVQSWPVVSRTDPSIRYKVSIRADGSFGCSCPAWIFSKVKPKPNCKHIRALRKNVFHETVTVSTVAAAPGKPKTIVEKKEYLAVDAVRSIIFFDEDD